MLRRSSTALAATAALLAAAPAASAAVPERPALLPAVKRTLTSSGTGCTAATYRAPMSGFVTARLTGAGDWDLVLRDAASRRRIGASRGFGGREVVQTWVAAGQRLRADACRRKGAGRRARASFVLADVAPPKRPAGKAQVVRVRATEAKIEELEARGLDVTHKRGEGWADIVVSGSEQLGLLQRLGLRTETRVADLAAYYRQARAADRAYARRAGADGSPLPSGRTEYRTYEEYQADLKKLADEHPDLVRPVVLGTTHQGREISGVEIAKDVQGKDGRPVHFLMGMHHAREWPSAESVMEFATMLATQPNDPRLAKLLERGRIVAVPIVNVDGFVVSRNSFSVADSVLGQDPNATLVEAVMPPGGFGAYRRKNCNGEVLPAEAPCELAWGVDNNRNYGNLWGGPGSSSDVTSQSYHGPGPRSEPETQAVWNFVRTHHVTSLVSVHTVAALVLRPPGLSGSGLSPDEDAMKRLGDAMGKAAGYTSQYSWQLYDTAGTTEDDTYAGTGGYGFTIEMGPPDGEFHMPYETGVVQEWTGDNDHAKGNGGLREALLLAAEAAVDPTSHAVVRGTAPAGKVLRLRKAFQTTTSPYCSKSVELLLDFGAQPPCLTGDQDPITLDDEQDTTTVVPDGGTFEWHVGQSTRPFVNGGAIKETETEDPEPVATAEGAPAAPGDVVEHELAYPAGQDADKLKITLTGTLPEDYDIEVLRDGQIVGSSAGLPGAVEEVLVNDPQPGTYVVRVTYFAAATGLYDIVATNLTTTRELTTGSKEAYELTCEEPDGTVLERRSLIIDRGQQLSASLGCGQAPSTFADGSPLPQQIVAALAPAGATVRSSSPAATRKAPRRAKVRLSGKRTVRLRRGAVPVRVTCPRSVTARCSGAVRLRGKVGGRKAVGLGARSFSLRPGRTATVKVRAAKALRRAVRRGRKVRVTASVRGVAGSTRLTGKRTLTVRR